MLFREFAQISTLAWVLLLRYEEVLYDRNIHFNNDRATRHFYRRQFHGAPNPHSTDGAGISNDGSVEEHACTLRRPGSQSASTHAGLRTGKGSH